MKQHIALPARHAFNVGGKAAVSKQVRLTVLWVPGHQGMGCLGIGLFRAEANAIVAQIDFAVVVGGFAQQELLQVWREFRKGLVHVGEHRVATAVFRALGDVQNRRQRRDLFTGHVGMPCLTIG